MTDLHRSYRCSLIQPLLLTLLTMGCLACLWEFKLQAWTLQMLGLPFQGGVENRARWSFVAASIVIALLSLIVPSLMLKRLVRNMRSSYRRMRQVQSQTETLAKYDSLSGLINRRVYMDLLRDQLHQAKPAVVMLIDLDHFKAINDRNGHSVGDQVLIEVASRLNAVAILHDGIVARLGGDEFCLLLQAYKEEDKLRQIAKDIISSLSTSMPEIVEYSRLGATIGISRSWIDTEDASALLHYADTAMYQGKNSGRSTFNFYDPDCERQRREQFDLDFVLKQALEHGEIIPYFQPIVALPSQNIVGFEILARWVKPDGSTGMPGDFIPVLERLGLIPTMTRSLVKQACQAAREWDDDLRLSLNVSAAMITDELFPDRLLEQLRHEHFPFDRFEVEITEEALVGNLDAAQRNLSRLHAQGITVALDDFGTGYSGLYHLTRLPIDKIKIDRSFFDAGQTDHLPVVEAILGMARSLKMQVTAEGIEEFHLPLLPSWLTDNGCHFAQGYLYGRPQAIVDIASVSPNPLQLDVTSARN